MAENRKNKGLGRGLDAFFGGELVDDVMALNHQIEEVDVSSVHAGKYQPRMRIEPSSLEELAQSIRAQGVISPIVVRPTGGANYEIIAGERRFRAALLAGLKKVPVLIRDVGDKQALAMALIENMQREDLNPLEEAHGIRRLIEEFGYTHEGAADAIGRSRSATSNLLRLLELTEEVKGMLSTGALDMGHARALLALKGAEQILAAKTVLQRSLSVRQTEELVKRMLAEKPIPKKKIVIKTRDDERLEEALAETLGATVRLTANQKGKGKIVIEFSNLDQLQGIVDKIQRQ